VKGASNIIAAFKHPDRVRSIDLWDIPSSVLKRFAAAMKEPFPTLTYLRLSSNSYSKKRLSFPIRSWADLPHVYKRFSLKASHFRQYQNYFRLPVTLSIFAFGTFPILGTFHPRRWSLVCPH
jgi:hypothetical protein